jgi:hypothetical protein
MTDSAEWLPPLTLLADHGGNWHRYLDCVYRHFCQDFKPCRFTINGKRIGIQKEPIVDGREATFWHLISTGQVEDERLPDLRRCERIRWVGALIEAVPSEAVRYWESRRSNAKRRNQDRLLVALPDFSYVVVLTDRGSYAMLITAYYVEYSSQRRKLQDEYNNFINSRRRP